jgi:hypothetical protein
MMRLVAVGVVLGTVSAIAAAQTPMQAAVRVEPAHLTGPRELAGQTAQSAIRDYIDSWKTMHAAFAENNPVLLNADFVGTAKDKLTDTLHEQAAAGMHTLYTDRSHDLQIVFYSPEGLSIEMTDNVEYDVQVFDHDQSVSTQRIHAHYLVMLTPDQVRWRVRVMQTQ